MKFFKSGEAIRKKLTQNLETLGIELEKKQQEYQQQCLPDSENQANEESAEREFFSRIFDPSDEYMQGLKGEIEQLKRKISKFELIIRNLPKDAKRIEISLDELEEFGF